jgi:CheY-like chemotaxis protein
VPGKKVLWSESIRSRVEHGGSHFAARASLRPLSAGSASTFLDIAYNDLPDLIVLPPETMELSPLEICERLRQDERTRSIPILGLAPPGPPAEALRRAGCTQVLNADAAEDDLQRNIAGMLGMRLRRYPRFPVVLPVARGWIFHEFLGYSNSVSEGGMGFETIARIRGGDQLALRLYRNTEEKPIAVTGRVAGVRPNIDTGVGYSVGVEFVRLSPPDRERLVALFPRDPTVIWGPGEETGGEAPGRSA